MFQLSSVLSAFLQFMLKQASGFYELQYTERITLNGNIGSKKVNVEFCLVLFSSYCQIPIFGEKYIQS